MVIVVALHDIPTKTALAGVFAIGGHGLSYLVQRRHPIAGSMMAAVFLFAMSAVNRHDALDAVQGIGMVLSCLIGFRLGHSAGWRTGLPLAIILVAALQLGDPEFNPIYEMMILGPWAAGQLFRSRSSVLDELSSRSADLRRERELLAADAIRLERDRIARELHDVLAHHISVIVIQTNATLRLAAEQPARAKEMLATVTSLCRQAESEMDQVTSLLRPESSTLSAELTAVADRARDTGTRVECDGPTDRLDLRARGAVRAAGRSGGGHQRDETCNRGCDLGILRGRDPTR